MNKPFRATRDSLPGADPASTLTPPHADADDAAYADTVPAPLVVVRSQPEEPLGLSLAPMEVSLYEAMAEVRKNNRVCPQPTRWLEFYRVLQEAVPGARLPAAPLTGSAWAATPPLAKRMCFQEQVEWAAAQGCLQATYDFLKGLPESDWLYGG